jgi:uncharacterized protein DUF3592
VNPNVVVTLGVLAVVWAALAFLVQRRFLKRAVRTTGVVEGLNVDRTSKGTTYTPVIRFETAAGASVVATANRGSSRSSYQVGQTIPVLYDPANPQKLEVNKFWDRWTMVAVALGTAVVLLFIGLSGLTSRTG